VGKKRSSRRARQKGTNEEERWALRLGLGGSNHCACDPFETGTRLVSSDGENLVSNASDERALNGSEVRVGYWS